MCVNRTSAFLAVRVHIHTVTVRAGVRGIACTMALLWGPVVANYGFTMWASPTTIACAIMVTVVVLWLATMEADDILAMAACPSIAACAMITMD